MISADLLKFNLVQLSCKKNSFVQNLLTFSPKHRPWLEDQQQPKRLHQFFSVLLCLAWETLYCHIPDLKKTIHVPFCSQKMNHEKAQLTRKSKQTWSQTASLSKQEYFNGWICPPHPTLLPSQTKPNDHGCHGSCARQQVGQNRN